MVLFTVVVAPILVLGMTLMVLVGLRGERPSMWLPVLQRWRERLRPWAMTEVFLLGVFVAYTRLNALARVEVGSALYALGGLMLMTIASDALLDRQAIWALLGRKCGLNDRSASVQEDAGPPLSCESCDWSCQTGQTWTARVAAAHCTGASRTAWRGRGLCSWRQYASTCPPTCFPS